jgi:hypothetical protein
MKIDLMLLTQIELAKIAPNIDLILSIFLSYLSCTFNTISAPVDIPDIEVSVSRH